MDLHTYLDKTPGAASRLAEQLGRSRAAVSRWREHGVPIHLMPCVSKLTGVKVDAMLKHALRCKTRREDIAA